MFKSKFQNPFQNKTIECVRHMSFLAGRLASTEGAYFLQESRLAVDRLIQKNKKNYPSPSPSPPTSSSSSSLVLEEETQADVLPEISLPSKGFKPLSDSTLERPPRGQLPEGEHSVLTSSADELPTHKYTSVDPEKLKAAAAKISKIAIASAVVVDVTTLTFGLSVSNLELQNGDDIRNKARDLFHPKFEGIEEQLAPLQIWAQSTSKEWRLKREEAVKESRLVKELREFSKRSSIKTSN